MTTLLEQLKSFPEGSPTRLIKILSETPLAFIGIEQPIVREDSDLGWNIAWAVDGPQSMKIIACRNPETVVRCISEELGTELVSLAWDETVSSQTKH